MIEQKQIAENTEFTQNTAGSSTVLPPADTADIRQRMVRQAKELASSALALEQTELFDGEPFEEALMLSPEEIRKRYTGKNGQQLEWRREACLYMLARQCPARDIARILHMNIRVIAALAAQGGRKLGGFSEAYAQELALSAAADFALAETRREEMSGKDLAIMGGIKMTHATNLRMIGAGTDAGEVIDVETESPALRSAREFLERKNENGKTNKTDANP